MRTLHRKLSVSHLVIITAGTEPVIPGDLPHSAGILMRRVSAGVMEVWDGQQWNRMNRSGFTSRFAQAMPDIAIGVWALVHSTHLAAQVPDYYFRFSPQTLAWALHTLDRGGVVTNPTHALSAPINDVQQDVADFIASR